MKLNYDKNPDLMKNIKNKKNNLIKTKLKVFTEIIIFLNIMKMVF